MANQKLNSAVQALVSIVQALEEENERIRQQLGVIQRALGGRAGRGSGVRGRGRPPGRPGAAAGTGKRGRRSKFTDDEVKVFRKRVESGRVTVTGLAKKLKVSVPIAYNYLRRAGWKAK